MSEDATVQLRPFPQLSRLQSFGDNGPLTPLYGKATNNELCFRWINRDLVRGLRHLERPALTEVGRRVADDLKATGLAFAQFTDFFPAPLLEEMAAFFQDRKREHDDARAKRNKPLKGKELFLDTVHRSHQFTPEDVASRYLSTPAFASIAADYMGMAPRYVGSSFWHTRQMPSSERVYSQLWHRDYNDRRLVKVFLYLTDVGPDNGPFEYVTHSHARGRLGHAFDRIGPDGLRAYPEAAKVDALVEGFPTISLDEVPADRRGGPGAPWRKAPTAVRCIGPAGGLIFADTFGIHRGGFVEQAHRDLIMLTYSTNFNVHKPHYSVTQPFADTLSPFMKLVFGVA